MKINALIYPLLVLNTAYAENSYELETLVVTGTRTQRKISDAPVKTEVITSSAIDDNHYSNTAEVIERIPGIALKKGEGRDDLTTVIQGLGSNRVLVLVDNVPMLQNSTSGFDLSQISTEEIEQIEVIKGGASALYGSQAIGGVINVLTKKPKSGFKYNIDLKASKLLNNSSVDNSNIGANVKALLLNKSGKNSYKLSIGHRERGAVDLDEDTFTQDANGYKKQNLNLYFSRDIERGKIYGEYRIFKEWTDSESAQKPHGSSVYQRRLNQSEFFTQRFILGSDKKLGSDSRLKTNISYEIADDKNKLNDNPATSFQDEYKEADQRELRTEVQWDKLIYTNHFITLGALYNKKMLNQESTLKYGSTTKIDKEVDEKLSEVYELFLQDDIINERAEFTPGIRFLHSQGFGEHLTPKFNMRYSPNEMFGSKVNIRSSIAAGYRTPSLKERFYLLDHSSFGYKIIGNKDLESERSTSYQVGIEFLRKSGSSFYANLFLNDIRNLISTEKTTVPGGHGTISLNTYQNISEAQTRGLELSHKYVISSKMTIEQDYTYTEAINKKLDKFIKNRPLSLYQLRFAHKLTDRTSYHLNLKYSGSEYTDDSNQIESSEYAVTDLKVNYNSSTRTKLYMGINNLFDKKREGAVDTSNVNSDMRPVFGRSVYVGFSMNN